MQAFQFGRLSQRSHEILNAVPDVQPPQRIGGRADRLENDADGARRAVIAGDSQRNALPLGIHTQNDKLPHLRLGSDQRRVNVHCNNRWVQHPFVYNSIHIHGSFPKSSIIHFTSL